MNRLIIGALVLALLIIPSGASAAYAKPSVAITAPTKGASVDRTATMPVTFAYKNITRAMVVVTTLKLVKEDTKHPSIGSSSGGTYQHTLYAGQTTGGFVENFGLNPTIPGKWEVRAELHECNATGCDMAPPGKLLAKSKAVTFTVRNDAGTRIETSTTGTTVDLLSPDGGESYKAGSGKLTIKWEAAGVPRGATVCTILEKRGSAGGNFAFPGEKSCKKAKNGKDSVTGKLLRTAGYDLAPGDYWARVTVIAKPSGGKDGATLAQDISDAYFTLR